MASFHDVHDGNRVITMIYISVSNTPGMAARNMGVFYSKMQLPRFLHKVAARQDPDSKNLVGASDTRSWLSNSPYSLTRTLSRGRSRIDDRTINPIRLLLPAFSMFGQGTH